jgi:hypothetical protein
VSMPRGMAFVISYHFYSEGNPYVYIFNIMYRFSDM